MNRKKGLRSLLAVAGCAATVLAVDVGAGWAATASGTATATLVAPLSIAAVSNLAFGKLGYDTLAAGTFTIAADGSISATGGLSAGTGAHTAATFTVGGEADAAYTITLPATPVAMTGPSEGMTLDNFTVDNEGHTIVGNATALPADGNDTLTVGARANAPAALTLGIYSGNFDVVLNYN